MLLIIENDKVSDLVLKIAKQFNKEVIIIDRLMYDDSKFIELINVIETKNITDVLFCTTWLYQYITRDIYKIMKTIKNIVNFWCITYENPCQKILEAIEINNRLEYKEYLNLSKHNFYKIWNNIKDFTKYEWILQDNILKEFLQNIEIEEDKLENLKEMNDLKILELKSIMSNPTNNYVKISNIQAFGQEWSNLKKDDIVSILKTPSTDTSPNWGVWVTGKTEPVKLINSDGYREYEYIGKLINSQYVLTAKGLAREIVSCKKNEGLDKSSMIGMLTVKINRISEYIKDKKDIHSFLTYEILDFADIPRRKYRSYFEPKLLEYYNNIPFFKELDIIKEKQIL